MAAHELWHENIPDMTQGDYEEHGVAFLRYGFDEGPLFVIEGNRMRRLILSKYADPDFEELVSEVHTSEVAEAELLQLWKWLQSGNIEAVQRSYPDCGW